MRKSLAVMILLSLTLAGCAGKKVAEEETSQAPAATEQQEQALNEEPAVEETAAAEPETPDATQAAEKIFFEFDSYDLTAQSQKALEGNAEWLKALPRIRITIEGHTDARGSDTYNLALGEKRARAAYDYLVSLGVDPDRISIVSYGEEQANQGASSESAWQEDRRAEFVVTN